MNCSFSLLPFSRSSPISDCSQFSPGEVEELFQRRFVFFFAVIPTSPFLTFFSDYFFQPYCMSGPEHHRLSNYGPHSPKSFGPDEYCLYQVWKWSKLLKYFFLPSFFLSFLFRPKRLGLFPSKLPENRLLLWKRKWMMGLTPQRRLILFKVEVMSK